ncbi:MAG: glycosyltransferase family 2 protein [Bacteroidota bacterium]|nr:glycosyltransferase family 2 protein [Bacteroidota bacterium]
MQNKQPEISVIIVARNEERFIRECIRSVSRQFSKNDQWELLLVDGMSEDRSLDVAREAIQKANIRDFRILENHRKTLATGWNLGIRAARGNFIIRPDAHAILYPEYISRGLHKLKSMPEVGVVGGRLETLARNYWGNIIREALSSRAGVGNSSFRTKAESGYKDTAVYGVYRKEVFEKAGFFNELLVRHQDNEFHSRVLLKGFKIYMNKEMQAGYYCRDNVPGLLEQMYRIGYYLPDLAGKSSMGGLRLRHLAPGAFFLAIILGLILGAFLKIFLWLSLAALAVYLGFISLNAIFLVFLKKKTGLVWLICIIPFMHFAYFLGTLAGFIKKLKS